jgi:hypothetical protein
MDIISHGLWATVPFYKRRSYKPRLAFLFGVLPDIAAFAPQFLFLLVARPALSGFRGHLPPDLVHPFTYMFYSFTHSLVIFGAVFLAVFFIRRGKFLWEMSGWGLHILLDIPTHNNDFFLTPFLWPISDFHINGTSWIYPKFLAANYTLLAAIYIILTLRSKRKWIRQKTAQEERS